MPLPVALTLVLSLVPPAAQAPGQATRLSTIPWDGVAGDVQDFLVHPSGLAVLFRADTKFPGSYGLYQVPIGGVPQAIAEPGIGKSVREYRLQGPWVSFLADLGRREQVELYSHRVGVPGATRLTRMSGDNDVTSFVPSPDGERIVFLAGSEAAGFELYVVPSDGSALPRQLTTGGGSMRELRFHEAGERVVFLRGTQLESVSVSGGGSVVLSPFALSYELHGDVVLYGTNDALFRVPSDGGLAPQRITPPLQSRIPSWRVAADGSRVVFLGDTLESGKFDLLSVPLAGGPATVLALDPADEFLDDIALTPDSQQVVYLTHFQAFPERQTTGIHVQAIDGSSAPRLLHQPDHFGAGELRLTSDSRTALYVSGLRTSGPTQLRLWSVRLDGTSPARRIDDAGGGLPVEFIARHFALTADGSRVLYAWISPGAAPALFSAPLDGSTAPVRLAEEVSSRFEAEPSGVRAVFIASPLSNGMFELFATALQGGTGSVRLSGELARGASSSVGGAFPLKTDPERQALVYSRTDGTLWHVPADGSMPSEVLSASESYDGWELSPDRTRVAFRNRANELRSVPASGTGPQVLLDVLHPFTSSSAPVFSPDGQWLVYVDDGVLHSVPAAGGAPVELMAMGGQAPLRITADSRRVVFATQGSAASGLQLWSRAIDGLAPAVLLGGTDVRALHLTPDGAHALYERVRIVGSRSVSSPWLVPVDGSSPPIELAAAPRGYIALPSETARCMTPDGRWIAFGASYATSNGSGVFACRTDGSTGAIPLAAGGNDELRVLLVAGNDRVIYQDRRAGARLFVTSLDGTSAPIDLTGPALAGLETVAEQVSPDGRHVVFMAHAPGSSRNGVYAAPLDGSSFAKRLDPATDPEASASSVHLLPDSRSLVYSRNSAMFQVPLDRSAAPRPIAHGLSPRAILVIDAGSVAFVGQDPAGQAEVYRASLWSVPFPRPILPR